MNRENKRKTFEKGYYKTHACNDTFTCKVCGRVCTPQNAGSDHRNHCPNCLSSLHVDEEPGDRASDCGGIMEPVAVWVRKGGEWAIIHRCKRCGKLSSNRVAADDNPMKLMSIAMKPLCSPPFPLDYIPTSAPTPIIGCQKCRRLQRNMGSRSKPSISQRKRWHRMCLHRSQHTHCSGMGSL